MKNKLGRFVLSAALSAGACFGQQDAVAKSLKSLFEGYRVNLNEAIAKVKESDYDFKPSADVKTLRGMMAHIADANYSICAGLKPEPNPNKESWERKNPGKAELTKAINDSFDYCNAAMEGWSDAKFAETVKRGTTERVKAYGALHLLEHTALHYGNLITYMRMKGVVPPETERQAAAAAKK
jgi:uncharacterized damage-inducible protein DinB